MGVSVCMFVCMESCEERRWQAKLLRDKRVKGMFCLSSQIMSLANLRVATDDGATE